MSAAQACCWTHPADAAGGSRMGIHSTFFGPIKYAILPQHLEKDEVLGGTGLVEAGTYIAILGGTILAGVMADDARWRVSRHRHCGPWLLAGRQVPSAPPPAERIRLDWHIVRASVRWSATPCTSRASSCHRRDQLLLDDRRGAVHPVSAAGEERAHRRQVGRQPVPRHLLDRHRDRLGGGQPAAEGRGFGPLCVAVGDPDGRCSWSSFYLVALELGRPWRRNSTTLGNFIFHPSATCMMLALLGIAVFGGMFVVPLYAFLTTTVPTSRRPRARWPRTTSSIRARWWSAPLLAFT